ncbi:geranylgeranylglycerol-phosphate geranylgeranyltransferase [bacterium]|nr:geranylgeranylglycerol-phosphate geranylgeranyltransferase [bacterium]
MAISFPSILKLIRPVNLLLTFVAVILGGLLASVESGVIAWKSISLAAFAASLVAGGAYAINDALDIHEDRINRPERVLVTGSLSVKFAEKLGFVLIACGMLISFPLGFFAFLFTATVALFMLLYVFKFKATPVMGNVLVAICAASSFPYGALAGGSLSMGLLPALLAAPVHLSRELIKDAEDASGDHTAGRNTLAVLKGKNVTVRLAGVIMLLTAMLIPVPFFVHWLGWVYFLIAVPLVALPLAFWAGGALAMPEKVECSKLQRNLKWIMLLGMLALGLGEWWHALV